ncbi:MAG: branched-chain amino acid ABC transporter permease [candidate division Zixibacteria bacterium]|nr:branched-chain amino acid ABC transporter permease [candidate division Zixibacteria bacterium]
MLHFTEELIIALMQSSTYVLIAIGFTLFFGAIRIIQFAHGDVAMLGALFALILYNIFQITGLALVLPTWLWVTGLIVATLLVIGILGVLFERVVIKPLRGPGLPVLMVLVSTVALGIFIRESVRLFYPEGSNPQAFPMLFPQWAFHLSGLNLRAQHLIMIGITVLLILAMALFINRTKMGLAIRAVSQNIEAASLMGINPDLVIMATFFVASTVAGVAGILIGSYVKLIKFDIGLIGGIKGFTAAIVGGLGSFNGAILGGLTLGFVETFCSAYIPGGAPYKDVYGFLMVVFFLVFRPRGLLGEKMFEKV